MKGLKINQKVKNAIMIGSMCSISYLAVYIARNTLGAVSPQMIEEGAFTTENIGTLSSVYFITYAFGQLINGAIGDKIKAKYMISMGLIFAGICNVLFSQLHATKMLAFVVYALTGFFLSMIYGPMTKTVAENTDPIHATRCSLGYTFASFFGSPLAGVLAVIMAWQSVFVTSSATLIIMGLICFLVFSMYERKGIIQYNKYKPPEGKSGKFKVLIKRQIIKFAFVSIITGVVRTTVVFWMPTYLSQHLKFPADTSALIFTVATVIISATAFIAVFMYERLGRNLDLTMLVSFTSAAICFAVVYFVNNPAVNIVFLVLAILSSNCAASMLFSRYCPSLWDTGMVSTATGFLDFMSYMAASISSVVFANAVAYIKWDGLIIVWFALMVGGIITALPLNKILNFRHPKNIE